MSEDIKSLIEATINESFERFNKTISESFDRISGTIDELLKSSKEKHEIEVVAEEAEEDKEVKESQTEEKVAEPSSDGHAKRKGWKGGINRSDLIREYFRKHSMEVKNKDLIADILKSHKIKIEPSLVSTIRKNIEKGIVPKEKAKTTAKETKSPKAALKNHKGHGLPMPALCTMILSKEAKEGLKIKEISKKAIEYGYKYKGKKGRAGVTQNVYQALHGLAQKKNHPGYVGKIAIVIHDEPSQRWKLNPKAIKAKKSA